MEHLSLRIKGKGILYTLIYFLTFPLTVTSLKHWRFKLKNRILLSKLIKEIYKHYNLKFQKSDNPFYIFGLWEVFVRKIYDRFDVSKKDEVIDIGATGGEYAILCASKGAKVMAIECEKESYELIIKNLKSKDE